MNRVRIPALVTLALLTAAPATSFAEPTPGAAIPVLPEHGASIVECYDAAVANLEKICEDYRRIKALELSRIRDIAYPDAYRNIQSVMPILKPIDREILLKRITRADDIAAHKKEVETVEAEVGNMVELVARLLTEIEALNQQMAETSGAATPITLEQIVRSPDFDPKANATSPPPGAAQEPQSEPLKKLAAKAQENPEQRAVDLSMEMRAMTAASVSADGLTRKELKGSTLTSAQISAQVFNLKEMNRDVGRQVVSEGDVSVEWMFVDTWYTIGPFPNPQRIHLNTKFPPETIINLGATYPGKDDRMVKWEFLQTNRAVCVPLNDEQYAIYYAYTELWFEEATDLWITIGSDDKANVWINNLPVWISGDQLKTWRINEGLRKVHFQKGVNRILYRVENGWHGTAFSLGIQLPR